jgi:general secretion pathway protein G
MNAPSDSSIRGFTLIELLIVVAIIGIISAIAIPNLWSAIDKAKQKRTMADMRVLGEAIEVYGHDHHFYPQVGTTTAYDLIPHLTPYVMQILPTRDGWNKVIRYDCSADTAYTLISFGSNFVEDTPYVFGPTFRFRDDIVFRNGMFVQWPETSQRY